MADGRRSWVQFVSSLATNSYGSGWINGTLYQGPLKQLCVPSLNCYSCPGALGSCPIGALQAVLGSGAYFFSFYMAGFLSLFGLLFGRLICGWVCPFGYVQELLHRLPGPKKNPSGQVHQLLKLLKYVILLLFVILLPLFWVDASGMSAPYFCKWLCPAGILEGALPLLWLDESLRGIAGWLFAWKSALLILTVVLSVVIFRPFCRYVCPLGAVYGLFNRFSFYRLRVQASRCTDCGRCAAVCPMQLTPCRQSDSPECIRCGQCVRACPDAALSSGFEFAPPTSSPKHRSCGS